MRRAYLLMFCCVIVPIVFGHGHFTSSYAPSCDVDRAEIDRIIKNTTETLEQNGYVVKEGQFKVFQSDSFGANPSNPYVTYFYPGVVESRLPIFSLKENAAVVFVGCTPATASYFSFRSYAFFEDRKIVFASLGDSLNNLVINTTKSNGNNLRASGGQLTAVVTTADGRTFEALGDALASSGLSKESVNLDAIPSDTLQMSKIKFIMLHRASVWESSKERDAYFAQSRRVLFVEAPKRVPTRPIPTLPLRKQGTGISELSIKGLRNDFDQLRNAVIERMKSLGYALQAETIPYDLGLDGATCIREGTNCKGDNHDTHYLAYKGGKFEDSNTVTALVGSNSVVTKKCTYTNIGLYKIRRFPVLNVTKLTATSVSVDNRAFLGSAAEYGVESDLVFAHMINRTCSDGNGHCTAVSSSEIPGDSEWALAYRTYLEPATATAPKLDELLLPRILKFVKD